MLVRDIEKLYFSKSALGCYDICQLKFRRRYLDGLFLNSNWVMDKKEQDFWQLGRKFHTLAERYYSRQGFIEEQSLLSEQLITWLERLIELRPYNEEDIFLPEQELRLNEDGLRLVAKYDLLYITAQGKVVIYDWKTNSKPSKKEYRRKNIQTMVYRYVLAQAGGVYSPTGSFEPEDISVIYWNPRFPKQVEPISYHAQQVLKDQRTLEDKITQIKNQDYDNFLATTDEKICAYCEYRPICHGKRTLQLDQEDDELDLDFDWDTVEEINMSEGGF
ncbi:PD-(D/E)XK nuclease family protein [Fuchsiella alkaliacetigena]|uniref:PD-(D/E)XK nuclease family protein n=1 Tax=Fuchsiella alkaliacetigena TaxID=957042 RepID=UPI00200A3BE1|nr:PD-(D/E)XK nuclease family protein [Fuchsiella alkaliacetigena]MCK8825662.1 PD-(D/E)XK nuclease family protein [Fuchsiella alkaliacetigena]